jgi:hypothetical protein
MKKAQRILLLVTGAVSLMFSGCSRHIVRDFAASTMVGFSHRYATPWFLASEDTDLMCAMGEGMSAMTYPFGPKVDSLIPMLSLAAATCAEERAQEEELRYLRALRASDIETAQDARTLQKRWLLLAAHRNYAGYQAALRAFGEPGPSCPPLRDRNEELSYLLGLLSGVQAFELDLATGATLGVPADTPSRVLQGTRCLASDEYWGLPDAMRATSQMMLAATANDQAALQAADAALNKASAAGEAQGVRLVHALQAALYVKQGNIEMAKEVIRRHVASKRQIPSNSRYRLLDSLATRRLTLISDQLWTQATGHRTPYGKLGTFWDDAPTPEGSLDIEDLLSSSLPVPTAPCEGPDDNW